MDPTTAATGGTLQLLGGVIQGNAAAEQNKYNAQVQASQNTSGPFKPLIPALTNYGASLTDWYNNAQNQQFINPNAGSNQYYQNALAQLPQNYNLLNQAGQAGLSYQQNAGSNIQDFLNRGGQNITMQDITGGASNLLNSDLVKNQLDSFTRNVNQGLAQDTAGIRSNDISSGNLGSSRGGIQEAMALNNASNRVADYRANLTNNALNQSQGLLQSNISNFGNFNNQLGQMGSNIQGGASNLLNIGNQQFQQQLLGGQAAQGLQQADINNQLSAQNQPYRQLQQYGGLLLPLSGIGNAPGSLPEGPKSQNLFQAIGGALGF